MANTTKRKRESPDRNPVPRRTVASGNYETSASGNGEKSISGYFGASISRNFGVSISGKNGTSLSDHFGFSISGDQGKSISGNGGIVAAGSNGIIQVTWWDESTSRYRVAVGYIGEGGLEPGVLYRWQDGRWAVATITRDEKGISSDIYRCRGLSLAATAAEV